MRTDLLSQIKKLRLKKKLTITAMPLLTGLTRQQYGKIEAGGNPSLSTLDAIVEALGASLVLVPKERLKEVMELLEKSATQQIDAGAKISEKREDQTILAPSIETNSGELYKPFKDL